MVSDSGRPEYEEQYECGGTLAMSPLLVGVAAASSYSSPLSYLRDLTAGELALLPLSRCCCHVGQAV